MDKFLCPFVREGVQYKLNFWKLYSLKMTKAIFIFLPEISFIRALHKNFLKEHKKARLIIYLFTFIQNQDNSQTCLFAFILHSLILNTNRQKAVHFLYKCKRKETNTKMTEAP